MPLSYFLIWLNNYSIGFSHDEYSALNKTFTFILRAVSKTCECLWITALSMNNTMSLFLVAGCVRKLCRVLYTKFSKMTLSMPPSTTWCEITLPKLMAAIMDSEYCYFFSSCYFSLDSFSIFIPYLPNSALILCFHCCTFSNILLSIFINLIYYIPRFSEFYSSYAT